MILSHRNWDYKKNLHDEFGAYFQSSQFYNQKNTNCPRTVDGIHLCPATNLQGGHQNMNLRMGQLITRPKLVDILITDVVINSDEILRRSKYLSH